MGWCGGTEIFDEVARKVICGASPDEILATLIEALEYQDWDNQCESEYWDDPRIRKIFKKLNSDWDWKEIEEE